MGVLDEVRKAEDSVKQFGENQKELAQRMADSIQPVSAASLSFPTFSTPVPNIDWKAIAKEEARHSAVTDIALGSTAKEFCKRILKRIVEFDDQLDQSKEVGIKLVSFGQTVKIHVRDVGFWNPALILFVGTLEDGSDVELIQHVSQISFMLVAVKRQDPNKDKKEMGFHTLFRELFGEEQQEK